ncbi:MAG: DUF3576 domain-containing protein [Kiloniellales bacterium]
MSAGMIPGGTIQIGGRRRIGAAVLTVLLGLSLAACGGSSGTRTIYPDDDRRETGSNAYDVASEGSVFGPSGLDLFGNNDTPEAAGGGTGIGVNAFLWRASLDTVSFMPLSSADPFGGVIITDWYSPPESPAERFKVNVFILGRDLRADGVRARVFRQINGDGDWKDAQVGDTTGIDLENAILTRARELRIAALN